MGRIASLLWGLYGDNTHINLGNSNAAANFCHDG